MNAQHQTAKLWTTPSSGLESDSGTGPPEKAFFSAEKRQNLAEDEEETQSSTSDMDYDTEDWRLRNRTLISKIRHLLEDQEMSDVVFIVGEAEEPEAFAAHRLIMAVNSPVFQAMFYGPLGDKEYTIRLPDVHPIGFRIMLRYFYTEEIEFESVDDAMKTGYVAAKYMVSTLQRECETFMRKNISSKNVCEVYEFVKLMRMRSVLPACLRNFIYCTEKVIASKGFKQSRLETVQTIVERQSLSVRSENLLFHEMIEWGKEECSRQGNPDLRKVIEPLLPHIRFQFISSEQLVECTERYGIPTYEELSSLVILKTKPQTSLTAFPQSLAQTATVVKSNYSNIDIDYFVRVGKTFMDMVGKKLAFSIKVEKGSMFLHQFSFNYSYRHPDGATVPLRVVLTIPGRFNYLNFFEHLPVKETDGVCHVSFPRDVWLQAGETVTIILNSTNKDLWCETVETVNRYYNTLNCNFVLAGTVKMDSTRVLAVRSIQYY